MSSPRAFKTNYKPLMWLVRFLLFLIVCFAIIMAYHASRSEVFKDYFQIALLIFGITIGIFGTYIQGKALIRELKSYTIDTTQITALDILTSKRNHIPRSDILGFSTSELTTRYTTYGCITIHLSSGNNFELLEYSYSNFALIKPALLERGYADLGEEPYSRNWLGNRHSIYQDHS